MDNQQELTKQVQIDLQVHEAVCEERWKTIFFEVRKAEIESKERYLEIKSGIESLQRIVLAGGGATILFLAGSLMGEVL